MLNTKIETLEQRANNLKEKCENFIKCEVIKTSTMVGGGTTPNKKIPTIALTLEYKNYKPNKLEEILRKNSIISRIDSGSPNFLKFSISFKKELISLIFRQKVHL